MFPKDHISVKLDIKKCFQLSTFIKYGNIFLQDVNFRPSIILKLRYKHNNRSFWLKKERKVFRRNNRNIFSALIATPWGNKKKGKPIYKIQWNPWYNGTQRRTKIPQTEFKSQRVSVTTTRCWLWAVSKSTLP